MEGKRIKLAEVSSGLREALRDHQYAIGVGPDVTIYTARGWPVGCVIIDRRYATDRIEIPVPDPAGVVWKPTLPDQEPLHLRQVSAGLRRALEQGKWYGNKQSGDQYCARGVGPGGTQYSASTFFEHEATPRASGRDRPKPFARPAPVFIERLPYRSRRVVHPEPRGVVWEPISRDERPSTLEEVSEELRRALEESRRWDGRRVAEGVGPGGMRCRAELRDGLVFIKEELPAGAQTDHRVAEPVGVVWRPRPRGWQYLKLEEISEGLRSVLEKAPQTSYGERHLASGVGPNGTEYDACLRHNLVTIGEVIAQTSESVTMPEPADVGWKPVLAEPDWVRLDEVGEGLRKALEEARQPDGWGTALGVGPDGIPYQARLHGGFVSIWVDDPCARIRMNILEPAGVVWRPLISSPAPVTKLEEVSEGLREALQEARWPDGNRIAAGEGPDGRGYRAHLGPHFAVRTQSSAAGTRRARSSSKLALPLTVCSVGESCLDESHKPRTAKYEPR
jgi:hypothetical protein